MSSKFLLACSASASAAVRQTSCDISLPARLAVWRGGAEQRKNLVSKRTLPGGVIQWLKNTSLSTAMRHPSARHSSVKVTSPVHIFSRVSRRLDSSHEDRSAISPQAS